MAISNQALSPELTWLYGTQMFGMKLGLENTQRLMKTLGLEERIEGKRILHIAGTNGKGSVCAFADAMLRAAGKSPGLFTSPHLVTFRERIRVGGQLIPTRRLHQIIRKLRDLVSDWELHPTFFELTLAVALQHFVDTGADPIILETGMGGRYDATNALDGTVSVITPVSFDHEAWLGNTLAKIAWEKAGIIKSGRPVVLAPQNPEAREVLLAAASALNAPVHEVIKPCEDPLGLAGRHPRWNAAAAVTAVRLLDPSVSESSIREGLATARWPGRFQRVGALHVLDGAHNPAGMETLVTTWRDFFGDARARVIFGAVRGKDTAAMLRMLGGIASSIRWVGISSQRGLLATELETLWRTQVASDFPAVETATCVSLGEALRISPATGHVPTLICGSLYLVGAALDRLEGRRAFEVSEQ
ncbi:MAG: folylpolyglutamate synthase/dihydrofolate synthase family protein [Verrucomicrobiales bacterium]